MPDRDDIYNRARDGLSFRERGLLFELGRASLERETRENGWVSQFSMKVGRDDTRILDAARSKGPDGREVVGRERKSGKIRERTALRQLGLERELMDAGWLTEHTWETVQGERIPPSVERELRAMQRDFPGRFHHRVISREDAAKAIWEGQRLLSTQLAAWEKSELLERAREAKEQSKQARQRLKELREKGARDREKADRARAKAERERAAREKAEQERQQKARNRADRLDNTFQRFRDGAERGFDHAADAHRRADSLTDAHTRFREAAERGRHEAARRTREREAIEREATRIREARAAHERTLQRLPREVADVLRRSFPAPGDEWLHRVPPRDGSTRAGREERARARERSRDGRERGR